MVRLAIRSKMSTDMCMGWRRCFALQSVHWVNNRPLSPRPESTHVVSATKLEVDYVAILRSHLLRVKLLLHGSDRKRCLHNEETYETGRAILASTDKDGDVDGGDEGRSEGGDEGDSGGSGELHSTGRCELGRDETAEEASKS
jgi:hypothetical protein